MPASTKPQLVSADLAITNDFEKLCRQLTVINDLLCPRAWSRVVSDYDEEQRARHKAEKAVMTGEWEKLDLDESQFELPELERKLELWEVLVFAEHIKKKMLKICSTFNDTTLMILACHAHLGTNFSLASRFVQVMARVTEEQAASELKLAHQKIFSLSRDVDSLQKQLEKSAQDCSKKFAGAIKVLNNVCDTEEIRKYLTAWNFFVSKSRKSKIQALREDVNRIDAARKQEKGRYETEKAIWETDRDQLRAKIELTEVLRQEDTRKKQEEINALKDAAAKEAKAAAEKAASKISAFAADNAIFREEVARLEARAKEEEERACEALESLAVAEARLVDALQLGTKLHEFAAKYSELEKTLENTKATLRLETDSRKAAEAQRADTQQNLRTEQEKVQAAQHKITRLQRILADEREAAAVQRGDLEGHIQGHIARYNAVCAENAQAKLDKANDLLRVEREAQEETERQVEKHKNEVASYIQMVEGRNAIQTAELQQLEAIIPCMQVLNPLPAPPDGPTCHRCQSSIVWRPDAEHQRDEWRAFNIPVKPPLLTHTN